MITTWLATCIWYIREILMHAYGMHAYEIIYSDSFVHVIKQPFPTPALPFLPHLGGSTARN